MARTLELHAAEGLRLHAETAADLMMPDPVSIHADASLKEAIALLIDRGFSGAPVIDDAGRPIGVLTRSDIVVHDREKTPGVSEYYDRADLVTPAGERLGSGFHFEAVDRTTVRDVMTPAVFAVAPEAFPAEVVHEMLSLKVHRLFVVDGAGVLVGVISALDILRHLKP
jgi:CBS domain-containing protein